MARSIAVVHGTAITPGVSRNGRLYTAEHIRSAVGRAQPRITAGDLPMVQRTHHAAEDDSAAIVGRLTSMTLAGDGSARYTAELADTPAGHNILNLIDTSDNKPPFLRGVSIRGSWLGEVRRVTHEGRVVETGDDLELDGLDYTQRPGVPGATVDRVERLGGATPRETHTPGRVVIFESVQEALVDMPEPAEVEEKGAPPLKSGKPAAAPTPGASNYADPGYQDDRAKRYPLDTIQHAKSAWSYVNQAKNAKAYTAPQLKRIKGRIKAALKKFGVKVTDEGWLVEPATAVTETVDLAEDYDQAGSSGSGSFRIVLTNGPTTVTVSSYCVDPADLEVVGHAAMAGAVGAITGLDPDLDGDIDTPGDDAETTTDDSMETVGGSIVTGELAETVQRVAQRFIRESPPDPAAELGSAVSAPPAPDPAADHTPDEEPDVSEPTTPAVEPNTPAAPTQPTEPANPAPATPATPPASPAEPAAPTGVLLSDAQFQALLANLRQPATAGVSAEAAPTPPAPVAETDEQRIARLVAEGIKAALPAAVIEAVHTTGDGPARKGLVQPVTETSALDPGTDLTDQGVPADWPQKPLHQYTADERARFVSPALQQHVLGTRDNLR